MGPFKVKETTSQHVVMDRNNNPVSYHALPEQALGWIEKYWEVWTLWHEFVNIPIVDPVRVSRAAEKARLLASPEPKEPEVPKLALNPRPTPPRKKQKKYTLLPFTMSCGYTTYVMTEIYE